MPKSAIVNNSTLIWGLRQEEPPQISTCTLYFQKLQSLVYIFAADSMGLSSFKFVQCVPNDASLLETECVWAIQGHPRSIILVSIESTYATSYQSIIVTMVLSCTVSEIRGLIGSLSFLPLSYSAPCSPCSLWNFALKLTTRKLELWGCPPVKTAWS